MDNDQEIREYQREYLDFLDDEVKLLAIGKIFFYYEKCRINFRRISEYIPTRSKR